MRRSPPDTHAADADTFVDELLAWMAEAGSERYDDAVTQTEHALQCAALAARESGDRSSTAAALLHDVGHLFALAERDSGAYRERDLKHERAGANWLARRFPEDVTAPVRLHVAAKRYLCAVEPAYWDGLSAGSKRSLALQGGPMSADEVAAFETQPGHAQAVAVRRWDDRGKVVGLEVPGLDAYRTMLVELVQAP